MAGNDVSQILFGIGLTYYASYGRRPMWLGFGVLCSALSCLIAISPHFIYGPGENAELMSLPKDSNQSSLPKCKI